MADQEQLRRLIGGVEEWNKWRKENPRIKIDLSKAEFNEVSLVGVDLREANLIEADLRRVDLTRANLVEAHLSRARLIGAVLNQADLSQASFIEADLRGSLLYGTFLNRTHLKGCNFKKARFAETFFTKCDLSNVLSLETCFHDRPSSIDHGTLQHPGPISERFLRGVGLSDYQIEYHKLDQPDLSNIEINNIIYRIYDLRAHQAIQISPLFISYSHGDSDFVNEIEPRLIENGIRYWRDTKNMTAGRIDKQIDRGIRLNDIVLLVLSEESIKSHWVEYEVQKAIDRKRETGKDTLCPVALDETWKGCKWPSQIMHQVKQFNVLNFSKWKKKEEFNKQFHKLIDGLDIFYK